MIAIITEKPSVGQQIARAIGAAEKHNGYLQGNGYVVTWALGHLLQLAPPETYGRRRTELLLIPDPFTLIVRRQPGEPRAFNSAASRQLGVIRRVLRKCDSVIAATDAGCEGELIFRRIYDHLHESIDPLRPARRSIDASKVTGHHGLLITGNYARELSVAERQVYDLICGRMLEVFAHTCERDTTLVEVAVDGLLFRSNSTRIHSPGWREVYDEHDEDEDDGGVVFTEGEPLSIEGHGLITFQTCPPPLFTEATLLAAMADSGLGNPTTRASIIEMLLRDQYIERSGNTLLPTDRGLALYHAIRDMRIADVELAADWERSLDDGERGGMSPETFLKAFAIHTRRITREVLSLDPKQPQPEALPCPKCREGRVVIRHRIARCDNERCGLTIRRQFLGKPLTDLHLRQLLTRGKTRLIRGFPGKQGKTFNARLSLDEHFNLVFRFPEKKSSQIRK